MPQNDRYKMTLSGDYCGIPWALGIAYIQLQNDQVGIVPQQVIVDNWFNNSGNVWSLLDNFLSNNLRIQCLVVAGETSVYPVFVNNRQGASASASFPPDIAMQVNLNGEHPHPGNGPGRFFLPGCLVTNAEFGAWKALSVANMQAALQRMVIMTVPPDDWFALIPHFGFAPGEPGASVRAEVPWIEPPIKRIASRKLDACSAFAAGASNNGLPSLPPALP